METEKRLGTFLVAGKKEGLGPQQPVLAESIVRCTQCREPETDPEGCCGFCVKCSLCCECGTFDTLSDEELLGHDEPAHVCHYDCEYWRDPDWPLSCGDED